MKSRRHESRAREQSVLHADTFTREPAGQRRNSKVVGGSRCARRQQQQRTAKRTRTAQTHRATYLSVSGAAAGGDCERLVPLVAGGRKSTKNKNPE